MNEKKLDLIARLLAKAEQTTPEEAEALTEHAERLMVRYGIEQAMINDRRARLGQTQEQIVQEGKTFRGVYAPDFIELGAQVAFALGTLRPLQSKTWDGGRVLYLVGYESDVRQALVLIASLEVQGMVAMRTWWARNRARLAHRTDAQKRRARSGFLRGFALGVRTRIEANRRTIIEEAGTGTDLVLASRLDRVNEHVGKVGKARTRKNADGTGFHSGVTAGQNANTGERALAQTSKAVTV